MRFTVLSPIATSMSAQMIFQFGFSDASAAAATAVTASRMRQSKVEIVRMMVTMKSSPLTCPQRVCSLSLIHKMCIRDSTPSAFRG